MPQSIPIKEVATAPITPLFEPTGWKTVGLDHLTFEVADYRKEAPFYAALMGWTLRSDITTRGQGGGAGQLRGRPNDASRRRVAAAEL